MYKVPYPPPLFPYGEEYQVVKRERDYQGCMEEYNLQKPGKGKAITSSL